MRSLLVLCVLSALAEAELPVREGSGEDAEDSEDLLDYEGSAGEFIEDLKDFGEHNKFIAKSHTDKILKVVPDSDDFDITFGTEDDYYDETYSKILDDYVYGDSEEDSVLKVTKDEEKIVDIEIKPKPPSTEDELLLDTAQILIMIGSAFISFGVVMLAFFLCRRKMEDKKEKAMPYTIPARPSTSPIVKDYQRVPTTTQQYLAGPAHIQMYGEVGKAGAPLLQ